MRQLPLSNKVLRLGPGLLGVMLVSFFAAFMSTIDTHLNWGASYLVNDVYLWFIKPQAGPRETVLVAKLCVAGMMILAAVIACTAGFASSASWHEHYASWGALSGLGSKMQAFIDGAAHFVATLGIPVGTARSLIAVMVVSFALTTLDSATRLLRYNIEEIGQTIRVKPLTNRFLSTTVAVTLPFLRKGVPTFTSSPSPTIST